MVQIQFKCDQFGAGSDIVMGVTGSTICPVTAMVDYLDTDPGPFFLYAAKRAPAVDKPAYFLEIRLSQPTLYLTKAVNKKNGVSGSKTLDQPGSGIHDVWGFMMCGSLSQGGKEETYICHSNLINKSMAIEIERDTSLSFLVVVLCQFLC